MEKVRFTEEKATMLATLYGRALDSREADPVLGDRAADEAVRQIDYDFAKLGITRDSAVSVVLRAKPIDGWAAGYLAGHPDAVVLHLGCGMDTRFQRLAPPETTHWYDVDYPEVVELREKLYAPAPNHTNIGTSVTDFGWLDQVPSDRPALIVAEGLTMYLTPEDGAELIRRLVAKFPSGELVCDVFSKLGIKAQKLNTPVRRAKATLRWGVDDPHELERYGLTLVSSLDAAHWATPDVLARLRPFTRFQLRTLKYFPPLARMARLVRYRF
ncbi:class I SAM-dependent methyltransferase [Amycolatopsis sp. SID8362]|uniref:class I SAM-dependent methyltransferase n=1 Tax=Amycolatopsis sp. SID8362 TaxID=2690346 RepID=UPI001368998D|nr:class I SAM-dependent methyltransferase [Amycolatopsis sp. SID8362]NBH04707.1 class I SAM-dependent methyltransferase [Amycolatopsis sp. SID8362]NED41407.1 class I SAM-dependent methyltransferase [Amycolatopsis sp. SID8362]